MTRRSLDFASLAGGAGAVFPLLLVAVWGAVSMIRRPPMSRVAAFLDPYSLHHGLGASTIVFDATVGALIGLAVSLLIARLARDVRWLSCIAFLSAFAAACVIPTALHEGWARMPKVLGQPLIFGFVAAVIMGFWLGPRIAPRQKPNVGFPG